jgi:hypothetical protein
MDVLHFLRSRTAFIRQLYEVTSSPYLERKRRIEAGEDPCPGEPATTREEAPAAHENMPDAKNHRSTWPKKKDGGSGRLICALAVRCQVRLLALPALFLARIRTGSVGTEHGPRPSSSDPACGR